MDSPLNGHTEQNSQSIHFDVSPERLNTMSPAELANEMEQALDTMTEETYDASVINAYLAALDRKTPMPEHLDAEAAYGELRRKMQPVFQTQEDTPAPQRRTRRLRGMLKVGLVAAVTAAGLLGGMVVAQAAGLDVFGAIARWTNVAFSFGPLEPEQNMQGTSSPARQADTTKQPIEVPIEYQDVWTELETQGVSGIVFPTYIPDGFQVDMNDLYISPESGLVDFVVWYVNGNDELKFGIFKNSGVSDRIYEKDIQPIETYESGNVEHYFFSNNGKNVAAWYVDGVEYSLSTSLPISEMKVIIDSMYQE